MLFSSLKSHITCQNVLLTLSVSTNVGMLLFTKCYVREVKVGSLIKYT